MKYMKIQECDDGAVTDLWAVYRGNTRQCRGQSHGMELLPPLCWKGPGLGILLGARRQSKAERERSSDFLMEDWGGAMCPPEEGVRNNTQTCLFPLYILLELPNWLSTIRSLNTEKTSG